MFKTLIAKAVHRGRLHKVGTAADSTLTLLCFSTFKLDIKALLA